VLYTQGRETSSSHVEERKKRQGMLERKYLLSLFMREGFPPITQGNFPILHKGRKDCWKREGVLL